MSAVDTTTSNKLLDYLPAIYREDPFLNEYLSAFEKILLGRKDGKAMPGEKGGAEKRSLEETIDRIPALFDPNHTPKDFLPWLASWAALSLRADLDESEQRRFVASVIQRYRRRGTKDNLIELLKIFTQTTPEINEDDVPSKALVDQYSQFAKDTNPLHFFKVSILLTDDPTKDIVQRKRELAHAIIQLEKPAHTFYELETRFESMQIGTYDDRKTFHANLGVDTLINDALITK